MTLAAAVPAAQESPISIGSRLEPLFDTHLVDRLGGKAVLRLNRPTPREIAITHDAPWEGAGSGYHTVFQDGDLYRMYYRGQQMEVVDDKLRYPTAEVICYAESRDGIRWTRPELGLVEFQGSRRNNILRDRFGTHNFTPFKDLNPACPPTARYKAVGGVRGAKEGDGLYAFQSADAIHWSLLQETPILTEGYFDSQNVVFWDAERREYRAYFRDFREYPNGRDIKTSTSKDFLHWSKSEWLEYPTGRKTQLYTNQVLPYYRAPHLFLGFPTRYVTNRGLLTPLNEKIGRAHPRFGNDYTDGGFMAGRDGRTFQVWGEAFLRPGPVREGRWLYGGQYQNWGLVETRAEEGPGTLLPFLPADTDREISLYASEGGWVPGSARMRRYTMRLDGFVSAQAPQDGGELFTKPLIFTGRRLRLNFATSAVGSVRVELQDVQGKALPGFALDDCPEHFGDFIAREITWKGGGDVGKVAGTPVRVRVALRDADVYAFRFE